VSSSSPIDPRIAATEVVAGPPDLVGTTFVKMDVVTIGAQVVGLPAEIPGVPQYVTVARAEANANALWPRLLEDLDKRGQFPHQPDAELVLDFRAAAGAAAASAISGLEAYSNHHLARYEGGGQVVYDGNGYTLRELREFSLDQRYGDVMPAVMDVPRPTQTNWWQTFRRIQGLAALDRHAVYEPTKRSGLSGEKSLTQRFVDREYRGAAQMMLDVFQHYSPGWISPDRASRLPAAPPENDGQK
jgi:hypothetical protein